MQVSVEKSPRLQELLSASGLLFERSTRRFMVRGSVILRAAVELQVRRRRLFKAAGRDPGLVTPVIRSRNYAEIIVGRVVKSARLQEYGGHIRPRWARAFTLPQTPQALRIAGAMRSAGIRSFRQLADVYRIQTGPRARGGFGILVSASGPGSGGLQGLLRQRRKAGQAARPGDPIYVPPGTNLAQFTARWNFRGGVEIRPKRFVREAVTRSIAPLEAALRESVAEELGR